MVKATIISFILVCLMFSGCALLNKVAPSQLDESGNPIPGTHDVSQPIKDVSKSIPYGEAVVGILLLAWNGIEKYRANKLEKGLKATVRAIKGVLEDPAMKEQAEAIKDSLRNAHANSGSTDMIKTMIAKV